MPKLSHPRTVKDDAINYLLRVYWNDTEFREELQEFSKPYALSLTELAVELVKFSTDGRQVLSPEDYKKTGDNFYDAAVAGKFKELELPPDLSHQHAQIKQMYEELQPYFGGLVELAYKWKLRAPWAGRVLHLYDMADRLEALGMPRNIDVPLEQLEYLHHWKLPCPDLDIRLPAWAFIDYTPEQIKAEIARKLTDYERELKAAGLREYPSRLEKHAQWWFEHYVHRKKYDDIAQEEAYTPGGSLISYAKNVGRAVRRFSRLIGIEAQELK
jgi:hypothetical protein